MMCVEGPVQGQKKNLNNYQRLFISVLARKPYFSLVFTIHFLGWVVCHCGHWDD